MKLAHSRLLHCRNLYTLRGKFVSLGDKAVEYSNIKTCVAKMKSKKISPPSPHRKDTVVRRFATTLNSIYRTKLKRAVNIIFAHETVNPMLYKEISVKVRGQTSVEKNLSPFNNVSMSPFSITSIMPVYPAEFLSNFVTI